MRALTSTLLALSVPLSWIVHLHDVCKRYDVPPSIVAAIAEHESGWTADIVSRHGTKGLCQFADGTWRFVVGEIGDDSMEPLDPYDNLTACAWLLGWLFDRYDGDLMPSLDAYAMGEGGASRYWELHKGPTPFAEWIVARASELEKEGEESTCVGYLRASQHTA